MENLMAASEIGFSAFKNPCFFIVSEQWQIQSS
jgi:hypothetical protein